VAQRPRTLARRAAVSVLLAVGIGVLAGTADAVAANAASTTSVSSATASGHHSGSATAADWWW